MVATATSALTLEVNPKLVRDTGQITPRIMVTPPLGPDYWVLRVKLSEKQAIVGFPKFMTIGIGFAIEEDDWNTNLPFTCATDEIFQHIKKNRVVKGDTTQITDDQCLAAIRLIQEAAPAALANLK